MLFNPQRNDYVDAGGPVRYLDDSGLKRPLTAPRQPPPSSEGSCCTPCSTR